MVEKGVLIYSAILLIGMASAMSTTLVINTAPNYSLMVGLYEPGISYPAIQSIYEKSNEYGRTVITFDISPDQYELVLALKDPSTGDYNLKNKRLNYTFNTGEDVEVNFYPSWYHIDDGLADEGNSELLAPSEENTTDAAIPTTENTTEEITSAENTTENYSVKTTKDVTAFSISEGTVSINRSALYYAGGLIVPIILIILVIRWKKMKPKKEEKIKVKKLSELKQEQNEDLKDQELKVREAREALREEEERLKKLRNPNADRIEEAKRKLIEDEKELMRLRRENSEN